jgi:hypothetical protein
VYFCLWFLLVFIKGGVYKKSNGVRKEKKFHAKKSGIKRSLCRLRPRLLHVVLDIFLIVCLVVLLQHDLSQMTEIA